jgi:hypothetical protein
MTVSYIYILGVTCTGKDYLMDFIEAQDSTIGSVRVGKILRERYPPDYFKGSGSPEHTEKEALEIFESEIQRLSDKRIVLISGQPRRLSQIKHTIEKYPGDLVWLHASDDVISQRISNRSLADQELALQRIKNDKIDLYSVLHELWCNPTISMLAFNTGEMTVQELYGELTLVI